jgi:hypothetical protein
MPMAYCSRVAPRFSNFAAATAAPMPAVMPVCDHATVPRAGGTEIAFDSRHVISMPSATASNRSAPLTGRRSANASAAVATGPAGCTTASACVSSYE